MDAEELKNRILMFDSTFTLLERIKYVYMDMVASHRGISVALTNGLETGRTRW